MSAPTTTQDRSGGVVVADGEPLLSVRNLTVTRRGSGIPIVSDFSVDVAAGETVGIVGESGCGKTTAVLGTLGLLDELQLEVSGTATYLGRDMISASEKQRRQLWGKDVGIIYQDALRALNPVLKVGQQIEEVFESHGGHPDVKAEVLRLLSMVGIADPEARRDAYPHQLSGGMRQRVMAAIAMAMSPGLLIADEPTTALDVTIQAQVLELIRSLSAGSGTSTLLISHDLGVIAGMCDRVLVLYAGRIVEQGPTAEVFANPQHHYTQALLRATPGYGARATDRFSFIPGQPPEPNVPEDRCAFADRCEGRIATCSTQRPDLDDVVVTDGHRAACFNPAVQEPPRTERLSIVETPVGASSSLVTAAASGPVLLEARGIVKEYGKRSRLFGGRPPVRALAGVDMTLRVGECLGLVGESGSGKTTLGRLLVGMESTTEGEIRFDDEVVSDLRGARLRAFRRHAQMIYQEPRSSLNRSFTIGRTLRIALVAGGATGPRAELDQAAAEMLERVGLGRGYLDRYPSSMSGGQCQRAAIARALCVKPRMLVADEAVSSLDVSIQGQILNLLADIQVETGIGIVFIAHDLGIVRELCHEVAVMYLGRIVESGPAREVLEQPTHPYSMALKSAAPVPDPVVERNRSRIVLLGDPPSPASPPPGCTFHTRCPVGPMAHPDRQQCSGERPMLDLTATRPVACHFVGSTPNRELAEEIL
ncbi:Glutathione import ATP-binding protein GsiA [Nocardioides dokdonensis FR1436]|uniref:Glutathione import ATP-binding protein GsiA n=1 Tax=Nocardioides dokdonensis FR1436 TaxID=1300347 RepID=A0A1A9GIY0_9ACTN|nr:ABC transporter ATP-binding protein [Nocardioides dokdonensis]ANH37622.1 Glutathione import ATP-binding protein GsiA [Nocardioides dokdonensis FR1436]